METATLWQRALEDPALQELPFKIESNEHGQLLLSPHTPRHSLLQSRVMRLLDRHATGAGEATVEFAVRTSRGVRVPDVVWISEERLAQIPDDAEASPVMPELIVEVVSSSNTETGMQERRDLYFEEGASEVWLCDENGALTFFDASGEINKSTLAPSSPKVVS